MSLRTGLAAAVTCAIVGASVALLLATGGSSGGTGSGPNASIFTPSAIDPAHTGKSVTGIPKRAERSRQQYRDLASRTAKRVARSRFRSALTGPGEGAPHLRRGERIVSFLDDYTARTKSGEKRGLLLSSLPLRTRDSDGAKQPIKLTLQRQAGAYVPESPLVPTRFGATLDRGLALHDLVTAVPGTAAGRSSAVAG